MVKITYVDTDGTRQDVDVPVGTNLMEAAVKNGVEAIEGECGGACACATCHVYIPEEWQHLTGQASEDEAEMLEIASDLDQRSRLGCQIQVTEALDGLVVYTPSSQR